MVDKTKLIKIYHHLKSIKEKYRDEILSIDGIHGIGIDTSKNCINVYTHKSINEVKDFVPLQLDNINTFLIEEQLPSVTSYNIPSFYEIDTHKDGKHWSGWYQYIWNRSLEVSLGTAGSWWWSKKLNKPILITNNHVSTQTNKSMKNQSTNKIPFQIIDGGVEYTGESLEDLTLIKTMTTKEKQHNPYILSLSTDSAKVGEIIRIDGVNFGSRKGYSKVFFGDKEAKIKSWYSILNSSYMNVSGELTIRSKGSLNIQVLDETNSVVQTIHKSFKQIPLYIGICIYYYYYDSSIEVYVPLNAGNELYLEREGDPIWDYHVLTPEDGNLYYFDENDNNQHGQIEDYIPIARWESKNISGGSDEKTTDSTGLKNYSGGLSDVGFISAIEPMWIRSSVLAQISTSTWMFFSPNRDHGVPFPWHLVKDKWTPNGLYKDPIFTNLVLKKSGARTGTSYMHVIDPSYDSSFTYHDGKIVIIHDIIKTGGFSCSYSGDSGSSVFSATIEEYNAFWNYYKDVKNRNGLTPPISITNTPIEVEENLLVGNLFGGGDLWESEHQTTYIDKVSNWGDYVDLCSLAEANFFEYSHAKSKASVIATVEIDIPHLEIEIITINTISDGNASLALIELLNFNASILSTSSTTIEVNVIFIVNSDLELVQSTVEYIPSPNFNIPFDLGLYGNYYVSNNIQFISFSSDSTLACVTNFDEGFSLTIKSDNLWNYYLPFNLDGFSSVSIKSYRTDLSTVPLIYNFDIHQYNSAIDNTTPIDLELQLVNKYIWESFGLGNVTIVDHNDYWYPWGYNGLTTVESEFILETLLYKPFVFSGSVALNILPNSSLQYGSPYVKPIRIGTVVITLPNGKLVEVAIVDEGRSRIPIAIRTKLPNEIGEFDVVTLDNPDASPIRITGTDGNVYALSKY